MNEPDATCIPFTNGSQADYWEEANCGHCADAADIAKVDVEPTCPLQDALWLGHIIGHIPEAVAVEFGGVIRRQVAFDGIGQLFQMVAGDDERRGVWEQSTLPALPASRVEPTSHVVAFCDLPAVCPRRRS